MKAFLLIALAALPIFLGACASSNSIQPNSARGVYWNWNAERLAAEGYPDNQHQWREPEGGPRQRADGIAYGPGAFFKGTARQEHPELTLEERYLESPRVRLFRSACCAEALLGNFLELLDMAHIELSERLQLPELPQIWVNSAPELPEWEELSGYEYWATHSLQGRTLSFQPIDILYRRTLAGHATRAGMGEALLNSWTHGNLPPWLRVGLASYLAEEGPEHLSYVAEFRAQREIRLSSDGVVARLDPMPSREEGRVARYNAFLMVWRLSEEGGFDKLREVLGLVAEGRDFSAACELVYQLDAEELRRSLDPIAFEESTLIYGSTR